MSQVNLPPGLQAEHDRIMNSFKPKIVLETFFGDKVYNSEEEFQADCTPLKDGRWRRKYWWERKR